MSKLDVVVGGQFGSEAKGACTGWLARRHAAAGRQVACVRVAGPNAGHSVIGEKAPVDWRGEFAAIVERRPDCAGYVYKLRQVPAAAVTDPHALLFIAAGSEIDWPVLYDEVRCLDAAGYAVSSRLLIDREATLLLPQHKEQETGQALTARIGSTGKGIGAARADRIWRNPAVCLRTNEAYLDLLQRQLGITPIDTTQVLHAMLRQDTTAVIVEGTQGYGLGLHAGYYPYCTSSDARAIDFLAMAGINPWLTGRTALDPTDDEQQWSTPELAVWLVVRPYPIRVAGDSGPMNNETDWQALDLPAERTTVTNKIRRVGHWDGALVRRAVQANGGPPAVRVYLSMFDQVVPAVAGEYNAKRFARAVQDNPSIGERVEWYKQECQCPIAALGTGPSSTVDLAEVTQLGVVAPAQV